MVTDIDAIFEKYLRQVMKREAGTRTEAEWEDRMAELYAEFGRSPLAALGDKSPEVYFGEMSGEALVRALADYVNAEISVPDFLCDAILRAPDAERPLVALLGEEDEELVSYAVNLLSDKGSALPYDKYLEMLESNDVCEDMKDLVAENLLDAAAAVKERVLARYARASAEAKGYFLELLVCAGRDDRIFEILKAAFGAGEENIPLYAAYFAKYGDERALPLLLRTIERPELNYQEFQELKFAIEALGGEYETKRDFSKDKIFRKIQRQREKEGKRDGE